MPPVVARLRIDSARARVTNRRRVVIFDSVRYEPESVTIWRVCSRRARPHGRRAYET